MIDTHAHLQDPCFDQDLDEVVFRAINNGVCASILVSMHPSEAKKTQSIVKRFPNWAIPALGLYPSYFEQEDLEAFDLALENEGPWKCIGEVGLDFWIVKDEPQKVMQENAFRHVVSSALQKNLPLNVHSRSASRRVIEILLEMDAKRVQLHAIEAKASTVRMGIEAGFYFSIPTSLSHSIQKQKLVDLVPLDRLLLESDSPVLAPQRGMRNEPSNIKLVLEQIAQIKKLSPSELESILDDNCRRLYSI